MKITRRTFLLAGAGATATCCGLTTWRACSYPGAAAYRGLGNFSPRQGVILAAIVATILPPEADRGPETLHGHVAALDAYCTGLDAGDRKQLGRLIYAIEHGTLFLGGHWTRFSDLSGAARADVLASWQTSDIASCRLGYRSLKAMTFLAYYRDPAAWAAVGYGGPMLPGGNASPDVRARYRSLLAPAGTQPA